MNALIITTIILSLALLLVLLYAHSITKEANAIVDLHRQATNQIRRLNLALRDRDIELIKAYTESAAWKEQYFSMIRSDKDFSQL